MAGRSYLARIAQPVRPGDPLVWSIPRPLAEETRPPAPRGAVASAEGGGPVRRATALARAGKESGSPPAAIRFSSLPPEGKAPVEPGSPAAEGPSPERPERMAPIPRSALASEPPPSAFSAPDGPKRSSIPDLTRAAAAPVARDAPSQPSIVSPPKAPAFAEEGVQAHRPRARAAPPPGEPAAPRLHIGTIEIRAPAPAPPPIVRPAPASPARSPAAPIPRAAPWRYGLVQG